MSYSEIEMVIDTIIVMLGVIVMHYFGDYFLYRLYVKHRKIYDKIFRMPPFKVLEENQKTKELILTLNEITRHEYE